MSIFEIAMLLCFGFAWPFSIYKSYKTRSTQGKSFVFLFIVWVGYMAGILHKVLYHWDGVIVFYIINSLLVAADIALFFRNKHIERQAENAIER